MNLWNNLSYPGFKYPLFFVSAGDLGTTADDVEQNLSTIFKISNVWGAAVIIDEADVFVQERSLYDLERNAMVAVFLRQLEYVPVIIYCSFFHYRDPLGTSRASCFSQLIVYRSLMKPFCLVFTSRSTILT
jgi:hypothetical protein